MSGPHQHTMLRCYVNTSIAAVNSFGTGAQCAASKPRVPWLQQALPNGSALSGEVGDTDEGGKVGRLQKFTVTFGKINH